MTSVIVPSLLDGLKAAEPFASFGFGKLCSSSSRIEVFFILVFVYGIKARVFKKYQAGGTGSIDLLAVQLFGSE